MEVEIKGSQASLKVRILAATLLMVGGFFSLALGSYFFTNKEKTLLREIAVYSIPFLYIFIVNAGMKKLGFSNKNFFQEEKISCKFLKTFFVGLLFISLALMFSFLESVVPFLGKKTANHFFTVLLQLLAFNLCIGFFEEGLFRRTILRILFKDDSKKSLWTGICFSSFLFGIIHFGNLTVSEQRPIAVTTQVIYAMLMGFVLSALYIRYKSFAGICVLHAFIDFVSYFPKLYENGAAAMPENLADIRMVDAVTTVGIMLPSAIMGLLLLISFSKGYYRKKQG